MKSDVIITQRRLEKSRDATSEQIVDYQTRTSWFSQFAQINWKLRGRWRETYSDVENIIWSACTGWFAGRSLKIVLKLEHLFFDVWLTTRFFVLNNKISWLSLLECLILALEPGERHGFKKHSTLAGWSSEWCIKLIIHTATRGPGDILQITHTL